MVTTHRTSDILLLAPENKSRVDVRDETGRFAHRFPLDNLKPFFDRLVQDHPVHQWFGTSLTGIEWSIHETYGRRRVVGRDCISEPVRRRERFDTFGIRDDPEQETTGTNFSSQSLCGRLERVANIMNRKIETDGVENSVDVSNVPCVNTKVSELVRLGPTDRLVDRGSVGIDGRQSHTNLAPLSKVTTATTPTVENPITFLDTTPDQFQLVLVVGPTESIHGIPAISS